MLKRRMLSVTGAGFEPAHPKILVPKTSALDHSAIQPHRWAKCNLLLQGLEPWTIGS
jgi:hypothetical protein